MGRAVGDGAVPLAVLAFNGYTEDIKRRVYGFIILDSSHIRRYFYTERTKGD
jgi:hypothetical protein